MRYLDLLRLVLTFLGFFALFVVERYLATSQTVVVLRLLGPGLLFLGSAVTWFYYLRLSGESRHHAKSLLYPFCFTLALGLASGLWFASQMATGVIQTIITGVWVATTIPAFFGLLGAEWIYFEQGRGLRAEPGRVSAATVKWLGMGLLFTGLLGLNYFAFQKDIVSDWSFSGELSPSEMTVKSFENSEVQVGVFFEKGNPVLASVREYVDQLAAKAQVQALYFDKFVAANAATQWQARSNGLLILKKENKTETIPIGESLDRARRVLEELDVRVRKSFFRLTRERKTVYFTEGHGEWRASDGRQGNPLRQIGRAQNFLTDLNHRVKNLGLIEGLGQNIPVDAGLLIIMAPEKAFLPAEVGAIGRWVQGGGRLLIALDHNRQAASKKDPLFTWLQELGVEWTGQTIAGQKHIVLRREPKDKSFLATQNFRSHDSMTSLIKNEDRTAVLFYESGWLNVNKSSKSMDWTVVMQSMGEHWADIDGDFLWDKTNETKKTYDIAAAGESGSGRVVVTADATLFSDALLQNGGNALFFVETVNWLTGEKSGDIGEVNKAKDVRIRHSRDEDLAWFYSTVLIFPSLVICGGWFAIRRRKRGGYG